MEGVPSPRVGEGDVTVLSYVYVQIGLNKMITASCQNALSRDRYNSVTRSKVQGTKYGEGNNHVRGLILEGSSALPRRMALSQRTPAERVPQVSAHYGWGSWRGKKGRGESLAATMEEEVEDQWFSRRRLSVRWMF